MCFSILLLSWQITIISITFIIIIIITIIVIIIISICIIIIIVIITIIITSIPWTGNYTIDSIVEDTMKNNKHGAC